MALSLSHYACFRYAAFAAMLMPLFSMAAFSLQLAILRYAFAYTLRASAAFDDDFVIHTPSL